MKKTYIIIGAVIVIGIIVYMMSNKKKVVVATMPATAPAGPAPKTESGFKASVSPVEKSLSCTECLSVFRQNIKPATMVGGYAYPFMNVRINALEKCLNTGKWPASYAGL